MKLRVRLGWLRNRPPSGHAELPPIFLRWLGPATAVALALALWRLGYDLNWTGRFAFPRGLFSHWQVWMALAVLLQVLATRLRGRGDGGAAWR